MEATVDQGWRKSSYSGNGGQCVEVAAIDRVMVRDSKDITGPMLTVSPSAWQAFVGSLRDASLASDFRA
jgi:uncharacterized protein DUF397